MYRPSATTCAHVPLLSTPAEGAAFNDGLTASSPAFGAGTFSSPIPPVYWQPETHNSQLITDPKPEPPQPPTPPSNSRTAQAAASANTASSPAAHSRSLGKNSPSPLFPIAIATFRSSRFFPVRSNGDPRNHRLNSAPSIAASHSNAGFTNSSRGGIALSRTTGACAFHGQTSWQISHPKTCRPIFPRNSSAIAPFFSIVR